jgi:hypothetical protein
LWVNPLCAIIVNTSEDTMALKFKEIPESTARPDERGRITLGNSLTSGVSRYDVFVDDETGEVLLRPYKEIPANEAWLFENKTAHELVAKGLESAKQGKTVKIDLDASSWIDDAADSVE